MATDHEVVELERALLRAPTRHDPDFLKTVLDEGMIEFGKSGNVHDKRSIMATLPASGGERTPDDMLEMANIRTVRLTPDVVLLTYRLKPREHKAIASLRSSIWKLGGGQWRLVFHQGTQAAPDGTGTI